MTRLSDLVVDLYGELTYKDAFRQKDALAFSWVSDAHRRRLRAYTVLRAYLSNMARYMLGEEKEQVSWREYGDAAVIVEAMVAALLGEDTSIIVDGAGEAEEGGDGEKRAVNASADAWQEWFDQWSDDERPLLALVEGETDACGLGDALYEVTYDPEKRRPRVHVHDPGMYFPVLDDETTDDFVRKLHLAWEFEREVLGANGYTTEKYVRRITFELVDLNLLAFEVDDETGEPLYDVEPDPLPWADEPPTRTCLKTDATWKWDDLGSRRVDDFDLSRARIRMTPYVPSTSTQEAQLPQPINRMDLGIDYIPVVHVPNTGNRKEHFGKSVIALALQVLDDLQAIDTDLMAASRTTATPMISAKDGVKDAGGQTVVTYGPGQVLDGDATLLDTSKALDALLKQLSSLLSRLSTTTQLPEAAMGRVDPSKVEAGVILALSFTPLARVVRKMRLVREEKHPLILKFVARYAQLYTPEDVPTGEIPRVEFRYGRFMPQDRAAVVAEVVALFQAKVISRLTAIQRLIEQAGYDIDDAEEELARIEHEDFEGAVQLADAIGIEAAGEYLDRQDQVEEPEPAPEPPDIAGNLPPVPGSGADETQQQPGSGGA